MSEQLTEVTTTTATTEQHDASTMTGGHHHHTHPKKTLAKDLTRAVTLVALGSLEGYAFATCGIADPAVFREQMKFQRFVLLKVFVAALGSTLVTQGLFSLVAQEKFERTRDYRWGGFGYKRVIAGTILLGCGMTLAGSGPTMLPSQIAVGVGSAGYVALGALVAGVIFSYFENCGKCSIDCGPKPGKKYVVEEHLGGAYHHWALPAGALMLVADYVLSTVLVPESGADAVRGASTWPLVAGLAVGLNQVPLRLLTGDGQGGSRSVMNVVATLTGGKLAGRFALRSWKSASQLLYVWGGTLLGAYIARQRGVAVPVNAAASGFGPVAAFLGGALMLLGSRLAGGCACGMGITGASELALQSLTGAACIFLGGIAFAATGLAN